MSDEKVTELLKVLYCIDIKFNISLDSDIEIIYYINADVSAAVSLPSSALKPPSALKAATLLLKRQHLYNKLFLCWNPGIYQYTYTVRR